MRNWVVIAGVLGLGGCGPAPVEDGDEPSATIAASPEDAELQQWKEDLIERLDFCDSGLRAIGSQSQSLATARDVDALKMTVADTIDRCGLVSEELDEWPMPEGWDAERRQAARDAAQTCKRAYFLKQRAAEQYGKIFSGGRPADATVRDAAQGLTQECTLAVSGVGGFPSSE